MKFEKETKIILNKHKSKNPKNKDAKILKKSKIERTFKQFD